MKILFLNRRDIKNPSGGGAEIYTHEVAKGFVDKGAEVTIFSSRFKNSLPEEKIEGIRYLRRGNEFIVHFLGFSHAFRHKKDYDLIIDEFNGLGFFGFLIPNSILLIHQLYREFWFKELGVFGLIPYFIEPFLLKFYRKRLAITISDSTRKDLEKLGFKKIRIVLVAIKTPPLDSPPAKEAIPTVIFLGRLRSTKRPADAIKIFHFIRRELPEVRLWMVGRGPEEDRLKNLARSSEGIMFHGWVGEKEKLGLLARAHVLVVPSVREGFGINVIEAASRATPAVGYDVPGLRDSIKNGATGYLASGELDAAKKITSLLKDGALYRKMSANCLEYAGEFNWSRRAGEFYRAATEKDPL
ncbi:MAG: glycosyltransferase family 4 protein [Nitrospiraceae bacterium]|nr:glycosyltransferase family 4 protein [Nitrospiraceae bacterium]